MPNQYWYYQNNPKTAPQLDDNDYAILGEIPGGQPGGPRDTAGSLFTEIFSKYGWDWSSVLVTGNHSAADREIVLCDTSAGAFTVTLPSSLADGSMVTVTKTSVDQNAITISGDGALMEPPRFRGDFANQFALLYQSESVTYIKHSGAWYLATKSLDPYVEVFYLPVAPVDLTPGLSLLNIALHPAWQQSYLFESNVGGLLTVSSTITQEIVVDVTLQAVFEHILAGNNQDVWGRVLPIITGGSAEQIVVPIDAAFAHSRAGTFGDTRVADSLAIINAGDTVGVYGEEVDSTGGSTTDVVGIIISFTVH